MGNPGLTYTGFLTEKIQIRIGNPGLTDTGYGIKLLIQPLPATKLLIQCYTQTLTGNPGLTHTGPPVLSRSHNVKTKFG